MSVRCLRLHSFEIKDGTVLIAAESASALTAAVNALQRCFPQADLSLEMRPRTVLQFGHVGRVNGVAETVLEDLDGVGQLLASHLILETELDECFALDFHQEELEDGTLGKTVTGVDVYAGKYQSSKSARLRLTERARTFIEDHPLYRAADRLAFVPPHTTQPKSSLAGRITDGLSSDVEKELVPLVRVGERDPQKDVDDDDRDVALRLRDQNQAMSMACAEDLSGQSVIVIDDLVGTGASLREAGRALRSAGAVLVLGLAMSKTRKFSRLK